jgi:DNA-binding GntR family transcriptional regulator
MTLHGKGTGKEDAIASQGRGLNLVRRDTLKEQTYREIRRALQIGKFEPGEFITVKHIGDEIGAGTMPIRESLQRLAAEGALVNLPSGRVRVPFFTAEEFDEIKEIRLRLEGYAVYRAAAQRSPEQLAEILKRFDQLEAVEKSVDRWPEMLERNYQFHFSIYQAANTSHLITLIDSLWLRVSPLLSFPARLSSSAPSEYFSMHDVAQAALIEALKSGDARGAEAAIREIILTSAGWYHRHYSFAQSH